MGIINAINGMKIYEREQDLIVFRTSSVERVLGSIFMLAAFLMTTYLMLSNFLYSMTGFCFFCLSVALIFFVLGFVLFTNKKSVLVDNKLKRIEIEESCPLGCRVAIIHFDEIFKFELIKGLDQVFIAGAGVWVVKAYIKRAGESYFTTEKVYHSMSLQEAKEVATLLSYSCNKELVFDMPRRSVALKIA